MACVRFASQLPPLCCRPALLLSCHMVQALLCGHQLQGGIQTRHSCHALTMGASLLAARLALVLMPSDDWDGHSPLLVLEVATGAQRCSLPGCQQACAHQITWDLHCCAPVAVFSSNSAACLLWQTDVAATCATRAASSRTS